MSGELFGSHYVTATRGAKAQARKLVNDRAADYWRIREWSLELAHYPHTEDWAPIRGLENLKIGRLKVAETIAGHQNLRIVFWKARVPLSRDPELASGEVMPRIWILHVFPKKRFEYTTTEKAAFKLLRANVVKDYYEGVHEP